jgi:hypothetical protein
VWGTESKRRQQSTRLQEFHSFTVPLESYQVQADESVEICSMNGRDTAINILCIRWTWGVLTFVHAGGKVHLSLCLALWILRVMQAVLCTALSDLWQSTVFRKVHRLRPFALLVRTTCTWRGVRSIAGMTRTGENRSTGKETCHSVHHRFHMNWHGIEAKPPWFEASN